MKSKPRFYVIVTSDRVYRGEARDESGKLAARIIEEVGFEVLGVEVLPNDYKMIAKKVLEASGKADVILVTGGTGPSMKDLSIDAVRSIAWRELPGFGALFAMLSYEEIGARAWLSRASAFIVNSSLVFVTPGSPAAVRLALEKLILPVVEHGLEEARKE